MIIKELVEKKEAERFDDNSVAVNSEVLFSITKNLSNSTCSNIRLVLASQLMLDSIRLVQYILSRKTDLIFDLVSSMHLVFNVS